MKTKLIILLCLFIAACASRQQAVQIKPTILPEIAISFPEGIGEETKTRFTNAIFNSAQCDMPNTSISITLTDYYESDSMRQFIGWPYKGVSITGIAAISINNKTPLTFKLYGSIPNDGVITSILLWGIPGFVISVNNLTSDIHDAESTLIRAFWKKVCKIYKKQSIGGANLESASTGNAQAPGIADPLYKNVRGVCLMDGQIIEGQILGIENLILKIQTKDGRILSYSFEKEVKRLITE